MKKKNSANGKRRFSSKRPSISSNWHILKLKNGEEIKLQGSYEYRYAKWLDENDIIFTAHPKIKLEYTDRFGGKHNYSPDFWVNQLGYVEIKSSYTLKKDSKKLDAVRAAGHHITVLTEVELEKLGIDFKSKIDANQE